MAHVSLSGKFRLSDVGNNPSTNRACKVIALEGTTVLYARELFGVTLHDFELVTKEIISRIFVFVASLE